MLSTSHRARARTGRGSAVVAAAALVVTVLPALALAGPSEAAAPDSVWSASSARPEASRAGKPRAVNPTRFRAYTLDAATLEAQLADAPEDESRAAVSRTRIEVPAPTGELVSFEVVETSLMEDGLAAAHPEIRSYAGRAVGFPDTIRIDVSPFGFHASVHGDHPAWYVDPAFVNDGSLYLSYFGADLPTPERGLVEPELPAEVVASTAGAGIGEGPDGLAKQRTYRLALLTDPSYANYVAPGLNDGAHDAESNSAVLAAKVTLMNRVNEIYEDDFGVRMVLIDDSDKLNLNTTAKINTAGGPCGPVACYPATGTSTDPVIANGCTSPLLTRTRLVIGQLVGAHSFDIGHIGLGIDGGGIASVGVVGGNSKAQGCTGLPFPVGDFYAIDYVAHEMGHQFSGNHTFNSSVCAGNRSAAASVEPGSGSSVMAYAGICGSDDLQPHTDPYFSERSQTEMGGYITSTLNNINEVDAAAFTGFDGTDSFTLTFGPVTTGTITRGTNYTAAGMKAAIEGAFTTAGVAGVTATVAGYFGNATTPTFTDTGIQVTLSGSLAGVDVVDMVVNPTGFTAQSNDIAKGGPPTNGGSTVSTSANHNPAVSVPAGKTIPIRTPFALTGSGTDSDGDALVYLWEQNDRGGAAATGLVSNTKANGPLFRVFGRYADVVGADTLLYHSPGENLASGSPTRVFPDMDQILAGTTNAATGACPTPLPSDFKNGVGPNTALKNGPVLECYSEFLPTADYVGDGAAGNTEPSLNFRLTARDRGGAGNLQAGGTDFADVKLRIDKTAGPFQVTSQAAPVTYASDSAQTVTWDVNGTNKPSLAQNVKISFSTDGGQTFPIVLAASTPNDGSEPVTMPVAATTTGRIKIEAVGNYFFDVNDAAVTLTRSFTLTETVPPTVETQYSDGVDLTFSAYSDFGDLSAEADGLPAGLSLVEGDVSPSGELPSTGTWLVIGDVTAPPGSYPVTFTVHDGVNTDQTFTTTVVVAPEDATVTYTGPTAVGAPQGGNDVVSVPLSAHVVQAADLHPGDLTTATVTFKDLQADEVLCADVPVNAGGDASCTYSADIPLQSGRLYDLQLQVGGRFTGTGSGSLSVTIDHADPETTITSGPAQGSFLLATSASLGFTSDEAPVTFGCTLDGGAVSCPGSPFTVANLTARTHTFTVAATDQAGNTDETPAVRSFTVPVDDAALSATRGTWKRAADGNAFLGTVSSSRKKGATLSTTVSGATSLALVASTGRKGGKVKVFLNGRLLRTVSLKGAAANEVLIPVATFAGPQSGTVTIVNATKNANQRKKQRTVVVDGLGVVTAP